MKTKQEKALFGLSLFIGLGAVIFGIIMMAAPVDTPLGLNELLPAMNNFPFQELFFRDLFWSGLALFLCNGVCNTVAVVQFLRKHSAAPYWALAASILLIVWSIVEMIYIPNAVTIIYWILAVVQLILSWRIIISKRS